MVNEIISRAAASETFKSNPVPKEMLVELSSDLFSFTNVPYLVKSNLAGLYPVGTDVMVAVAQDWADSLEVGAIRLFDESTISFALSLELMNGSPVTVSIRRSDRGWGLPWYMSFAPDPARLRIRREGEEGAAEPAVAAATYPDSIPKSLEDAVLAMGRNAEYANGEVPAETIALFNSYTGEFGNYVWVPARWSEKLCELTGLDMDVVEFLNREWTFAVRNGCIRYFEGKVIFPVSVLREDGATPVEVSIRRDERMPEQPSDGALPWFVVFVEDYAKTYTNPRRALREWAWLGDIHEFLSGLASVALPERWDFDESKGEGPRYAILRNYISYTFYRLQAEDKVLVDEQAGVAVFNTGLVDSTYEAIYACFSHSEQGIEWKFESFCKAGSRGWGKKLVSIFNPLPERASYIERKEDLFFDSDSPLTPDTDHILIDNINRLPREFLEEELMGNAEALELVERAFDDELPENRTMAFDELSDLVEENIRIRRRLKNRLDDAIELACKRAAWNFKTAVPAWYPTRDVMSLLLPLDLTEDDRPDVALVVQLTESGAYIGQTILTMPMAYSNARLICRPDSDWLNTSLRLWAGEEEDDE